MLRCGFRNPGRFLLAAIVLLSVCVTPSASGSTHAAPANLPATGSSSTAANDSGLLMCNAAEGGDWTTTSAAFEVIRQCTLTIPEAGSVYLSASAWVGLPNSGSAYKADFRLGLDDSTTGDDRTDRRVSIEPDSGGDGQDKSTMVSLLAPITSGQHTFYFLGARDMVSGTVLLHAPSLSVLYFPAASAEIMSCGAAANDTQTITNTLQEIRSCPLTLPESGSVYLTASAGAGLASGGSAYLGDFQLGVDDVAGTLDSLRLVDIYPDGGSGSGEVVAAALFVPTIVTGTHTFYFSGMLDLISAPGPMQVQDASLSVLFFPASNTTLKLCGVSDYQYWSSVDNYFTNIRSCNFSVPNRSLAFVEASAWADMYAPGTTNEWEGNFRLGLDDVNGSASTDRQLNVYDGQGYEHVLADSGVFTLMPGDHTFYLAGRRTAGSGRAESLAASLFVLNVPGPKMVYLPLILK